MKFTLSTRPLISALDLGVIPANINKKLEKQISNYTKQIYTKLNMSGVVRIDYIFDLDSNQLYFNEINTIPGMTDLSDLPAQAKAMGWDFDTLVKVILNSSRITDK